MKYRHHRGRIYIYLFEAVLPNSSEKVVVYKDNAGYYARPLREFYGLTDDGRKRFEPMDLHVLLIEISAGVKYRSVYICKAEHEEMKKANGSNHPMFDKFKNLPFITSYPFGSWDGVIAFQGNSQ